MLFSFSPCFLLTTSLSWSSSQSSMVSTKVERQIRKVPRMWYFLLLKLKPLASTKGSAKQAFSSNVGRRSRLTSDTVTYCKPTFVRGISISNFTRYWIAVFYIQEGPISRPNIMFKMHVTDIFHPREYRENITLTNKRQFTGEQSNYCPEVVEKISETVARGLTVPQVALK